MAKTKRGLSEAERRARDRERLQHRRGTATLLLAHPGIGPETAAAACPNGTACGDVVMRAA
jgi:transposase